jgi:hypothetical protein
VSKRVASALFPRGCTSTEEFELSKDIKDIARACGWVIYWMCIFWGGIVLGDAFRAIEDLDAGFIHPDQPGYQTFTIANVALRLGVVVCLFLAAFVVRPRKESS